MPNTCHVLDPYVPGDVEDRRADLLLEGLGWPFADPEGSEDGVVGRIPSPQGTDADGVEGGVEAPAPVLRGQARVLGRVTVTSDREGVGPSLKG